jgi:hypothetical protein
MLCCDFARAQHCKLLLDLNLPLPPKVFSRHASSMSLAILRRDGAGYLEVALDPATHRTGDVWHVELQGLRNVGGLCYGWRASGDKTWAGGRSVHGACGIGVVGRG